MADDKRTEKESGGGVTIPAGGVTLTLNPPPPAQEGVRYGGCWLKIEADDQGEGFFARLFAEAEYTDAFGRSRKVVDHLDLQDEGLAPLKEVVRQIIAAYEHVIREQLMAQGYRVREHALLAKCAFCDHRPEHPAGECRSEGCKCDNTAKEVK